MHYFISYYKKEEFVRESPFHNDIIKIHPFRWQNENKELILLYWKEISNTDFDLFKHEIESIHEKKE